MSVLQEKLEAGEFVITGEIGPPKGLDLSLVKHEADLYRGKVHAVNVTDQQSAVMRLGSMSVSKFLLDYGIEPIFQLVCRDRNRIALQSDALGAAFLGLENVLCVTGDHVLLGDHPGAKPVFDLDAVSLLYALSCLEKGYDLSGAQMKSSWGLSDKWDITKEDIEQALTDADEKKIKRLYRAIQSHKVTNKPKFFKGAVVSPVSEMLEAQIDKLKMKIDHGAQFIQTQTIYDVDAFETFMDKISDLNIPIICGHVLLKSFRAAKYMNENIPGIVVPEELLNDLSETPKEDQRKKSVDIATQIVKKIKPMCQGIHIMPLGWIEEAVEILDNTGLKI